MTDRPFKDAKNDLIEEFERTYQRPARPQQAEHPRSAREAGIERAYLQRLICKYGMRD